MRRIVNESLGPTKGRHPNAASSLGAFGSDETGAEPSQTSYVVFQRSRETGIRMALGANARQLVWLQMRRTMTVVLIGSAAGIAAALAGGLVLKSTLVGVSTTDIATLNCRVSR